MRAGHTSASACLTEPCGQFIGYMLRGQQPFAHYSVVDASGRLVRTIPITISEPVMMHDFAITTNHSVIMDLPLIFRKGEIVKDRIPFVFDKNRASRFLVLPRHATSESEGRWFESPACFVFHTAASW